MALMIFPSRRGESRGRVQRGAHYHGRHVVGWPRQGCGGSVPRLCIRTQAPGPPSSLRSLADAQRGTAALPVGVWFLSSKVRSPVCDRALGRRTQDRQDMFFFLESWHFFCLEEKSALPPRERSVVFCLSKAHRQTKWETLQKC